MMEFLRNLFTSEKQKQRDVITLDAYAMSENEEEEPQGCCGPSGCGSCGCG